MWMLHFFCPMRFPLCVLPCLPTAFRTTCGAPWWHLHFSVLWLVCPSKMCSSQLQPKICVHHYIQQSASFICIFVYFVKLLDKYWFRTAPDGVCETSQCSGHIFFSIGVFYYLRRDGGISGWISLAKSPLKTCLKKSCMCIMGKNPAEKTGSK